MKFLSRFLPPFLLSWLLTFSLASLFHSQYVVNGLVDVGIAIELSERLSMTIDDWLGLLPTYGIIIAIAFALAFPIAQWLGKRTPNHRPVLFASSGLIALAVVLMAIESIMNINIIAGARGAGFYFQLGSGMLGGLIFSLTTKSNKAV